MDALVLGKEYWIVGFHFQQVLPEPSILEEGSSAPSGQVRQFSDPPACISCSEAETTRLVHAGVVSHTYMLFDDEIGRAQSGFVWYYLSTPALKWWVAVDVTTAQLLFIMPWIDLSGIQ